jgi:hypothetical protein
MKVQELAEEIAALEQHLAEAQQSGNRPALHHLVAADYSGINAHGRHVDRDGFIDAFVAPGLMLESVQLENVAVRIFDHVALATGISYANGLVHDHPFRTRYHFTDIWTRRMMHWELVAGHVSPAT